MQTRSPDLASFPLRRTKGQPPRCDWAATIRPSEAKTVGELTDWIKQELERWAFAIVVLIETGVSTDLAVTLSIDLWNALGSAREALEGGTQPRVVRRYASAPPEDLFEAALGIARAPGGDTNVREVALLVEAGLRGLEPEKEDADAA